MPQVATKFFRRPDEAEKALAELRSSGYQAEEVGVLVADKGDSKRFTPKDKAQIKAVTLPGLGAVVAIGATATALPAQADKGPEAALTGLWDIPVETFNYYQLGLSLGGVVVSVHTEDLAKARGILRAATRSRWEESPLWANSPGFAAASRMAATNPIDAPMSGDFRKY